MAGKSYTPKPFTDLFTHDTEINRRKCQRTVPMRVLALGLGRTGTASLRTALKELGFDDCYHMLSASVENPPDCLLWSDALAAKYDSNGYYYLSRAHWDQLTGHCQAIADWPAVAFAKELIEAYPEAKVILNTRDVHSWHASTMKTVHWRATEPMLRFLSHFDWAASMYQPMLSKFWTEFWEGDFENNGKRRFVEYHDEVRSLVPKERLLEYRIGEGWGPLCEFLDVPTPKGRPFPHVNDTAGFVGRCQKRNRMQLFNVLFRFLVLSICIAVMIVMAWVLFVSRL